MLENGEDPNRIQHLGCVVNPLLEDISFIGALSLRIVLYLALKFSRDCHYYMDNGNKISVSISTALAFTDG